MDYTGQNQNYEKPNFEAPKAIAPDFLMTPDAEHDVSGIGNAALLNNAAEKVAAPGENQNTGIFSPEEIVSVEQEENLNAFLPADAVQQSRQHTTRFEQPAVDLSVIKTGKQLSSEGEKQVVASISNFNKTGNAARFVNDVQKMVAENLKNSYGREIGKAA